MPGSIVASLDKFPGCCQDPTNIHVHILTMRIIIIYIHIHTLTMRIIYIYVHILTMRIIIIYIYVHILPVRIIISHSFANVDYCEGCEEF